MCMKFVKNYVSILCLCCEDVEIEIVHKPMLYAVFLVGSIRTKKKPKCKYYTRLSNLFYRAVLPLPIINVSAKIMFYIHNSNF